MDPITAAGLGLSVTSLTFQLFSGCIKSYQLLQDVADMPERFGYIRVRMRLEQIRLLSWGEKIGLLGDVLEAPSLVLRLHHNLIFDILFEVSRLFTECLKIDRKFSTSAGLNTAIQDNYGLSDAVALNGQSTKALLAKATGVLRKSSELPKRLEWAVVKQDKFEKLVEQLISYNNSMLSLLDSTSLQQIHEVQIQSGLTLLQLSTKVENLRQLTQAVQLQSFSHNPAPISSQTHTHTSFSGLLGGRLSTQNDELDLARLATFKAKYLDIEQTTPSSSDLVVDTNEIVIIESNSRIDTATFRGKAVWLEWKEFDQQNRNPWYKDVLENRVKKLVSLLSVEDTPIEFRGPKCLGYVHEVEDEVTRYGLVNKLPTNASNLIPPKSLLEVIRHESSPSLSQRIKLASALADSLMHLHSVNWLHKGIRSENVLFFLQTESKIDYSSPTVSGFEYARPDRPDEMTEKPQSTLEHDIYRHPSSVVSTQARSLKSWDIYSLGIVLIEIAAWKSIDAIAGIDFRSSKAKSQVSRLRDTLLQDQYLEEVCVACGDLYREVVVRCVTGGSSVGIDPDADEFHPQTGSEMIRIFSQDIVGVLKSIRI